LAVVTIAIEPCDLIIPTAFTPDDDQVNDNWEILNLDEIYPDNVVTIYNRWGSKLYQSEKGMPFSWKEYFANTPYDIKEYIDSDLKSTFHDLLNADVLIGSKSGLSHLTAMFGDQIKLMPYMWHSYKGTKKVIELPNSGKELDHQAIANHIKSNILLADEETSPKCDQITL
jgi:gliding motility-associated-like protein